ncbi:DUF4159 domain-containing protein [Parasedimentitalea psychrophila]|uniref:DUF4159 domain-containing protein n=1 Tax=Parasedimentitalea psychrophila TaxID=2997337 RepID=A0A9Y2L310_9RHOB|nr:DUF4159 domain-containing protein [Parasedimentitalea psychrophila]WIY26652.1 DUF4159 domain-containing protein [Parasedimentitalea psychrophila]
MTLLAGIGFTTPWLLLGLLALPILWLLLRAVPPAPVRRVFPAVTLLLGLSDDESLSDRTPWWLLLLRMLAVAAAIIGLSGPVLNPAPSTAGRGSLLLVLDASWVGANDWRQRREQITSTLTEAGRAGRTVAVLRLTAPEPLQFQSADVWRSRVAGLGPQPWQPNPDQIATALDHIAAVDAGFDTLWFADGLEYPDRDQLISALRARGELQVHQSSANRLGLLPAQVADGAIELTVIRSHTSAEQQVTVLAQGVDPGGTMRVLASASVDFTAGADRASARLILPSELRARITRFELQRIRSAGAVALTDDSLRRREVALISSQTDNEGLVLLSPVHYLRQALQPTAELFEGGLGDLLPANPDVIILADVARLAQTEEEQLTEWVEKGGMLLRFAGPRLAASDISRSEEHPLMPVRLRSGGRSLGGAMSWGEPKTLAPFQQDSPFYGLTIPEEVTVSSQVVAQPDPSLADRVIAELADGTPLVTRKPLGQGQVVLFHVTANAEWTSLPLSGLFVDMLERLAVSTAAKPPAADELEGTVWTPIKVLDGFGRLSEADTLSGVDGPDLMEAPVGPDLRPGLYDSGSRKLARNVLRAGDQLQPAIWPHDVPVIHAAASAERALGGALISLALVLLALDVAASLALSGLMHLSRTAALVLGLATAAWLGLPPHAALAQQGENQLGLSSELALAHVLTGDDQVDEIAHSGLRGLSNTLSFRTSIEPSLPVGVDLERDELAFYPLLYWPITPDQPRPSAAAYTRLNAYLRTGGMILFDTRDANLVGAGASSANARKLQQLARSLDIPPLEPLPADHVLTRAFYLLQNFPGRHQRGELWVEAAPADAEHIEGMPFRNLNDGVTPVVIGGNDWGAAWAVDNNGRPRLPVGRGFAGERQRELAYRFGVNLVMHVLTGNYKSDQVHVPALLDRLGQ